jgi:hypothetical protein
VELQHIKVTARMHEPDGNTRQRDVWVRQIEQGGIVDVHVDLNDRQGIKWLHDNHFKEACDYFVCHEGEAVTADKLQSLANATRQHSVKVDICASSSFQLLVHSFVGSIIAVDVQHGDTVDTFKQRYNRAYSNKTTCTGSIPSQRFMFGDKTLIGSDVLDELGLKNGDVIRVQQGGLLGGISSGASSFSNDAVEPFADEDCVAYNRQVVMNYGVKDFHVIHDNNEETAELRCPMCDEFLCIKTLTPIVLLCYTTGARMYIT